jgi:N-acetylglucosaminyl-diphospho-decaprenol L-rhamnosyltransferase
VGVGPARPPDDDGTAVSLAGSATSVVIVNYRTAELTLAAVASVLTEPEVVEVVVVDNASGDGSAERLRAGCGDPRVRVVESGRNGGFGAGVNAGAHACTAPLLLVLNSDATLVPGSLRLLAEALLEHDNVGIVAPAVYRHDGRGLESGTSGRLPRRPDALLGLWWHRFAPVRPTAAATDPGWVSGVAMILRRSDFVAAGCFDERFEMYFEDVDLCRRLGDKGKLVRRVPSAGVVHSGGRSWRSRADKRRRFHRSKLLYFETIGATPVELAGIRVLGAVRTGMARLAVPLRRTSRRRRAPRASRPA